MDGQTGPGTVPLPLTWEVKKKSEILTRTTRIQNIKKKNIKKLKMEKK